MGRRLRAAVLSAVIVLPAGWVGVLAASPAVAFAPSPTGGAVAPEFGEAVSEADAPAMPAFVIADLVGEVAPESDAYAATTYQIGNWQQQGGAVRQIDEGLSFVQHVPGFMLGEKIGGYIDHAFGIDPGTPDPTLSPNGDVGASAGGGIWTAPDKPPWELDYGDNGKVTDFDVKFDPSIFYHGAPTPTLPIDGTGITLSGTVDGTPSGLQSVKYSAYMHLFCSSSYWSSDHYATVWVYNRNNFGAPGGYTLTGPSQLSSNSTLGDCANTNVGATLDYADVQLVNLGASTAYPNGSPNTKGCFSGSPCTPPATPANPARQWVMTTKCEDGSTSTATSDPFHETDSTFPPVPGIGECPVTAPIKSWELDETYLDGSHVRKFEAWTEPASLQQLHDDFAQCTGATSDPCTVRLWQQQASGREVDCFRAGDACADWARDPNRADTYTCTYGPASSGFADLADIGLSGCYDLGPTFDPDKRSAGKVYSNPAQDPGQGKEVDNSPGAPVGKTRNPDTSTETESGTGQCYPHGWGVFNPVEWVLQPIECAFIPDPAVVREQLADTWGTVESKPPASVIVPMVAFVQGAAGGLSGSCGTESVADFGHGLVIPCDPPDRLQTFVTAYKAVIDVVLFSITAYACLSMLEDGTRT